MGVLQRVQGWAERTRDGARMRRHKLREAELRALLYQRTGQAFMDTRDDLLEVVLCPDPMHCQHVQ